LLAAKERLEDDGMRRDARRARALIEEPRAGLSAAVMRKALVIVNGLVRDG
jgi:hypothetical protein